ncbi:MAG TPA: SAM-dependent methyltransferase [Myxococcales bacterium]|nr:SAM-dependent methyltransferase [Deltaproteobacteria bacterium]HAA55333.1 SAM-dependent methyltransferase [Myxococcales bacterium]
MPSWAPVIEAIQRRASLREQLHKENTYAYRLFHGAVEGIPGLCIDRYGPLILAQTFKDPVGQDDLPGLEAVLREHLWPDLHFVYNHRKKKRYEDFEEWHTPQPEALEQMAFDELGVRYHIQARHEGIDPWLFLDMRVGRRYMLAHAKDKRVLNLFAYTCGIGVCAALAGAKEVWNVDFAQRNLQIGRDNAALNDLPVQQSKWVQQDVFPVIRQLAGLKVKGRGRKRSYEKIAPSTFDIVFLDPPKWAKGPFGAVDLVRDYQSLFKPALLATKPGGTLIATNNVHYVDRDEWLASLTRCAEKAGRPIQHLDVLLPEEDFPSHDGQPPLKIALCKV